MSLIESGSGEHCFCFYAFWVLLLLGLFGSSQGLNDGTSKDETLNLPQDKDRGLLEHFNVSKGQFHDSASLFQGSDQVMYLYLLDLYLQHL